MVDIARRKDEHIDIVLGQNVASRSVSTGLEAVRFAHVALPELDLNEIDISTEFAGRRMSAPILVSSMTGGPQRAGSMNVHIAEACNALGLAFGVGSQRIALEGGAAAGFGPELRRAAPNVPILANFGAAQLQEWDGPQMAQRAVEMIEADALIIHLNPLQEAVQSGGDTNWRGLYERLGDVCRAVPFPVVVKEVGAGISGNVARRLVEAGVAAIDVAGAGGTSWAAVEAQRAPTRELANVAEAFRDWGIPTATAIADVRSACPQTTLIASGGLKDGVDCAKAIRLGADLTGFAAGVLRAAMESTEATVLNLTTAITQMRIVCFCTGSRTLTDLRRAPLVPDASTKTGRSE